MCASLACCCAGPFCKLTSHYLHHPKTASERSHPPCSSPHTFFISPHATSHHIRPGGLQREGILKTHRPPARIYPPAPPHPPSSSTAPPQPKPKSTIIATSPHRHTLQHPWLASVSPPSTRDPLVSSSLHSTPVTPFPALEPHLSFHRNPCRPPARPLGAAPIGNSSNHNASYRKIKIKANQCNSSIPRQAPQARFSPPHRHPRRAGRSRCLFLVGAPAVLQSSSRNGRTHGGRVG